MTLESFVLLEFLRHKLVCVIGLWKLGSLMVPDKYIYIYIYVCVCVYKHTYMYIYVLLFDNCRWRLCSIRFAKICTGVSQFSVKFTVFTVAEIYEVYHFFYKFSESSALFCLHIYIYIKVKCSRYRPGVAQRVGRVIALLFHDRGTRRGWVVSSTPRLHFTPGKDPVPIVQEAGWAPGPVWTGGKSRPHRDSTPDHPGRIQSLYRLSYRAHIYVCDNVHIIRNNKEEEERYIHETSEFSFCIYKTDFLRIDENLWQKSVRNNIINTCGDPLKENVTSKTLGQIRR